MKPYELVRISIIGCLASPIMIDLWTQSPLLAGIITTALPFIIKKHFFTQAIIFLLSLSVSGSYYWAHQPQTPEAIPWMNHAIEIHGQLESQKKKQLIINAKQICHNKHCKAFNQKVIVFQKENIFIPIHAALIISGKITIPHQKSGYTQYLKRQHIHFIIQNGEILNQKEQEMTINSALAQLKNSSEQYIFKKVQSPANSIVIGLLTGSTEYIPQKIADDFKQLGLSHILAISGYNITVIVALVERSLSFLMPQTRFLIIIPLLIIFTLFVGAEPPIVRACIMGIITLSTLRIGSNTSMTNTLLVAALCMYLYDPLIMTWDVSFQLSFAATIGIVYLSPQIKKFLKWIPEKWGLRENCLITITAQISTLPIMLVHFDEISIIAPLANLIILPIIPWIMATSVMGIILGIIKPITQIALIPTELLCELLFIITDALKQMPFKTYSIS